MIKRILPIALAAGIVLTGMSSCTPNGGFKTTKSGLEYKIVKDVPGGQSPKMGDFVEMHIHVHIGDSDLFNSRKMNNNMPFSFPVQAPSFKGDPIEGFMMLTPGDSAVFRVAVDSLKKAGAQLLPWMKPGQKLEYDVVLVSIKNKQQMKADADVKSSAQRGVDDKMLQDYFAKNNLHPEKTPSGVYYIMQAPGSGDSPKPGQTVTVNYTGKTLDGKTFDSNQDSSFHHTQPFSFTIGQRQVIPGWDEGVAIMKKGGKATLYIPSPLAYGAQGQGPIPPNAILMFDVAVTDIK